MQLVPPVATRDIRYQAAVIEDGRLLLLRCVPVGEPGFWVLPGGGREAGESAEACVAREVREEAGVEVAVGPLLYEVPAEPPDGTYRWWRTYLCRIMRGEPAPGGGEGSAELTAVRWLALDEPEAWEPALRADHFLHPQLLRIHHSLRDPVLPVPPPAGGSGLVAAFETDDEGARVAVEGASRIMAMRPVCRVSVGRFPMPGVPGARD